MSTISPRATRTKDGTALVLRPAEPGDAAAILALVRAVHADGAGVIGLPEEFDLELEEERRWIEEHAQRPGWLVLVAEAEGELVGLVNFEDGGRARVAHRGAFGISVLPGWRGRGIGRLLLEALLEWARDHPVIEKVTLAVLADNAPAIALYRSLGFVEEGRRPREVRMGPGRYVDDLLMYLFT